MCVICVSPKGVRQPSVSEIKKMFHRNPDGAGYMYARDGKVHIHKGYMDLEEFLWVLRQERFTAEDSVVYHFRISTQAGVNPAMTHPFPLSNQREVMKALDVQCGCGIAHNGIIRLTSDPDEKEYSDTALFIANYMSRMVKSPDDLHDSHILEVIGSLIRSKMAILDGSGFVATVGEFFNDRGLLYSNLYHRMLMVSIPKKR